MTGLGEDLPEVEPKKLSPGALELLAEVFGPNSELPIRAKGAHLILEVRAWLKTQTGG